MNAVEWCVVISAVMNTVAIVLLVAGQSCNPRQALKRIVAMLTFVASITWLIYRYVTWQRETRAVWEHVNPGAR